MLLIVKAWHSVSSDGIARIVSMFFEIGLASMAMAGVIFSIIHRKQSNTKDDKETQRIEDQVL